MGMLDGKVCLVTGAGRGIGRECALLAAQHGAKVVVNDLGGSISGEDGGSPSPAQEVVDEIQGSGGEAVVNSESVTDFASVKRMVEQALDTFGGLHSVINPAGILRDGMLHKMTPEDWQAVIDVHLQGAFNVTRATIELFREQREGSYVLFGSTAALIGNAGQANYAAAKMGVAGLSRVLAMEGASRDVRSNLLVPFAWTRMLDSVKPQDDAMAARLERMKNTMRADQVAQMAVTLCIPEADVSGQIFIVRGNEVILFNQPRPVRSMSDATGWTPEKLISHGFPAMRTSFTDLGPPSTVFPYDPV